MNSVFTRAEYAERYERLQLELQERGLDRFLSFSPENIYYLTGFQTPGYYFVQCLVVPAEGDPTFVVRNFETPNVEALTWLQSYRGYQDHEDAADVVAEVIGPAGGGRIGYEATSWFVPPAVFARLQAALGEMEPVYDLIEGLRLVKSPAEVELIRKAARFTEAGMRAAFEASRTGNTEDDVAAATYHAMIARGSSYPSLPPFIATGSRSALPHATWSGRPLERGDVLFYETGGVADRYGAALVRVGVIGEPAPEIAPTLNRAVGAISEAIEALIEAIKPGVTGEEVHRASRGPIERAGWGDVNRNRSGYSIGISFPPDWGEGQIYSLREHEHRPLEPGMVFHLVPNVLIPDVAGVCLSETVLVTDAGCEALTSYPRELVVV
jgi:Xaa-Pro dipeptidase